MFRALIVEDDTAQQKIYDYLMRAAGFQVTSAYNGQDAIQQLEASAFPHLIILDAKMPQSNGLDVLQFLETYPDRNQMRIVIATAGVAHDAEYLQYKEKFPAVDFLLKPELLAALPRILQQYTG